MIAKSGSSLIFYAHYVNGGTSATGLTVTVDIWEVQRDGTAAEIVTAGAATEIGDGLYRYLLVAGSVDAAAEYVAVFKTAGTVDQEHLPAIWTVDRNVPEAASTTIGAAGAGLTALGDARLANLDAAMSTRATPAQVNTEADTALADAGVTSARMAYLTGPVATAAKLLSYFQSALRKDVAVDTDIGGTYDDATDSQEALSESLAGATVYATGSTPNTDADLYIRRGDTVAVTIGDLTGLAAGWDVLWVTIKRSEHDADSAAILQVRLNVATPTLPGLIYINGQAPTDAGVAATDAWISDVDAGADTLVLNIKPAASLLLPARGSLWWDVQQLDGTTLTSLTTGEKTAEIGADITRATS